MNTKRIAALTALMVLLLLLTACGGAASDGAVFDKIVQGGYSGSEEELIASLVGEELSPYDEEKSAYELACEKGYSKSADDWMKTVAGAVAAEDGASAYSVACENGYDGSFAEWLAGLCENPDELGISGYGEKKTDYEYACEYGYEGSFIEWLISLINDKEL